MSLLQVYSVSQNNILWYAVLWHNAANTVFCKSALLHNQPLKTICHFHLKIEFSSYIMSGIRNILGIRFVMNNRRTFFNRLQLVKKQQAISQYSTFIAFIASSADSKDSQATAATLSPTYLTLLSRI